MYLHAIRIKNFRGLGETTVRWRRGVNVLVGPNNSGKTAVFDALRLCLGIGTYPADLYVRREDYHVLPSGETADLIEFDLTWRGLTDEEKGVYIEMLVPVGEDQAELQLHVRFEYDAEREQTRRRYWGGEKEGQEVSGDVLKLLEYVHLGALRDATRDLAPGRGNQLSHLFLKLATKPEGRKRLAKEINDNVRSLRRWRRFLVSLGSKF